MKYIIKITENLAHSTMYQSAITTRHKTNSVLWLGVLKAWAKWCGFGCEVITSKGGV